MKKLKPVTEKRLLNAALFYLSKYESSSEKVRQLLKRRVLKAKISGMDVPEEAGEWIEKIVAKVVADGYVDDKRYAENTIRRYKDSGKSSRFIAQKLRMAGIEANFDEDTVQQDDLTAAKRLVKKKKLGPFRDEKTRRDFFKKDLAVLARAGFSFSIAAAALETDSFETEIFDVF